MVKLVIPIIQNTGILGIHLKIYFLIIKILSGYRKN